MIFTPAPKPTKTVKKKVKARDPRKTLENKLDTLVSQICRKKGKCEACGRTEGVLNAHHFKSRKYKGVRWYLPNLICLCVQCHTFNFNFSAHKTPEAFRVFMIEIKGQEWADRIEMMAQMHTGYTLQDIRDFVDLNKNILAAEVTFRMRNNIAPGYKK